ncbi:MAG: hypothetical protein ABI972_05540 [Acidobacteriota bacterium]
MRRTDSSPDIVALLFLTVALLWLVPVLERHAEWLPFHTEWPTMRLPVERAAGLPVVPLQ